MSDKWQLINLKLDAELAQALRELKQGHDESLSEVVLRLLRRLVRQTSAGARGAPTGRSNPKGRPGRGAAGVRRAGKPVAAGRGASRVAAPGKPWEAPAAPAWDAGEGTRGAAWGAPPQRGARRVGGKAGAGGKTGTTGSKTGKPPRSPQVGGSNAPRRRSFRAGAGEDTLRAPRPRPAPGAHAEGRPGRPRKAKGRRSTR